MDADDEPGTSLLAYERTRIASDRTLMAWVRTAVSLIGFGFSIPKFFAYLAANEPLKATLGLSPRALGILLIALGTVGLADGIFEHIQLIHHVAPPGHRRDKISVALVTSVLMAVLGILALINVVVA